MGVEKILPAHRLALLDQNVEEVKLAWRYKFARAEMAEVAPHRERIVIGLMQQGLSLREIALFLDLTLNTVRTYHRNWRARIGTVVEGMEAS